MNNTDHATLPSIQDARLPESYDKAKTALAECSRLDECQSWADKAAALASYAKQSKDDSLLKMAERIKARAIRRAGELLKQIMPSKGGRPSETRGVASLSLSRKQAAEDAGLSEDQRKNALRVASIDGAEFDALVESDNPPTLTKLAEIGTKKQILDLKGRDPKEFNKSLHFIALFERHLKKCDEYDIESATSILTQDERAELRSIINKIDAIHDQIMTRV